MNMIDDGRDTMLCAVTIRRSYIALEVHNVHHFEGTSFAQKSQAATVNDLRHVA